jgi:hypothetical protein
MRFVVELPVPPGESFSLSPVFLWGGDGRFDIKIIFLHADVGLRSQSLADPTLRYGALSGRRAVF